VHDGAALGPDATEPAGLNGHNGRAGHSPDGGAPPERAAGRPSSGRGLRNWRVRSRLLLLITIPTLTAVVLGGMRITSSVQSATADQRVLQLARLSSDITVLVQRLQDERDQTVYFIAEGNNGGRTATPSRQAAGLQVVYTQRHNTERAASVVEADLGQIGSSFPAQTRQEAAAALADLENLPNVRLAATNSALAVPVVVQKYANIISDLLVLEQNTALGASDATLSQTVRVLGLVSRMKEDASQQRAILAASLIQGSLSPTSRTALVSAESDQAANLQSFDLSATAAQRQLFQNSQSRSFSYLSAAQEQQALSFNTSLRHDPTSADDFYGAMTNVINFQMGSVERDLVNNIIARAVQLRNEAIVSAIVTALAVAILLGLALVLTVLVARSLVRPLRRLRAGALEIAGVRLPETVRRMSESEGAAAPVEVEPINVDSSDEIGEVARAFDQVHREAIRLASNEAALRGNVNAMFVNLSRRSQSLVERQIRLIDDLEQGEQDAERLSNLFQMDHLATRMRRNSENLLVLAGHEVSRRWTQSVPLVDVLRAAVSEIEQYERVTLNVQPGIAVRGQGVNDVVHLIAELVENASSFSAADTPVKVSGHLLNSGGVLLDITDQGVGMGAEEMAHANWRLDNPPVVDVAVSRRMGLFVVARLAARHGIRVRLRPAPGGGLTALVWLPDEVISHDSAASPTGLRRFDLSPGTTAAVAGPPAAGLGSPAPAWPEDSESDGRAAAASALNAARTPRFAPLRPDLGDTAAFSALGSDLDAPAPAESARQAGGDRDRTADYDTSSVPAFDEGAAAALDAGGPSAYDTGSTSAFGTGSPSAYDTGSTSAYDAGGPSAYDTGSTSARDAGRAPAFDAGGPSAYDAGSTSARDLGRTSAFDTDSMPAYDAGSTSARDLDRTSASALGGSPAPPSTPAESSPEAPPPASVTGPLPVYGAPSRSERQTPAGAGTGRPDGNGNGNELPFRRPGQVERGVVVPPAASAGEEHRLPIFESVESDWFRRGRHGTARPPQTGGMAAAGDGSSAAGWSSPADEGWRAAEAAHVPTSGGVTLSGLPKRVPRANLVPGTVGVETAAPAAPASGRSATQARDRLASFQRGMREGRAAAREGDEVPNDEDNSGI
jgi:signal transduction histidine kinase